MRVGKAGCGYAYEDCVSKRVWRGLNWKPGFMANHEEGWESLCSQAMFLSQVPLSPPPGPLGVWCPPRLGFSRGAEVSTAPGWWQPCPQLLFVSLAAFARGCIRTAENMLAESRFCPERG